MIDRRRFLHDVSGCTLMFGMNVAGGLALAPLAPSQKSMANFRSGKLDENFAGVEVELLGVPKTSADLGNGLHPFSPERTLAIDGHVPDGQFSNWRERLLDRGFGGTTHFSTEKLDYILWSMAKLTRCYRVPDYFEDWATRLAAREDLGVAMGTWKHCGFIHQFQPLGFTQPVSTRNGLVDWWLFLVPNGIDFQSQDGLATHVLFGCVEADSAASPPRQTARLGLLWRLVDRFDDWAVVSRMDLVSATRQLNRRLVNLL